MSLYIILGKVASSDYFCNLAILNIGTLEERRQKLTYKFAKKILKHPVHRNMFEFKNILSRPISMFFIWGRFINLCQCDFYSCFKISFCCRINPLYALRICLNEVSKIDIDQSKKLIGQVNEGIIQDYIDINKFWKKYDGNIESISKKTYDIYLKQNNIDSGIKNYNESISLILNYKFQ